MGAGQSGAHPMNLQTTKYRAKSDHKKQTKTISTSAFYKLYSIRRLCALLEIDRAALDWIIIQKNEPMQVHSRPPAHSEGYVEIKYERNSVLNKSIRKNSINGKVRVMIYPRSE